MTLNGKCHCGTIAFTLDWPEDQPDIPARACNCSFCVKHGGVWTSNPKAQLSVVVQDADLVSKYVFGTETANVTDESAENVWWAHHAQPLSGGGGGKECAARHERSNDWPQGAQPHNPDDVLAGYAFGFLIEIVDEDVVAQPFGIGEEGAAAVDSGDVVDEAHQAVAPFEHERVDAQAFAGAAAYFQERLLQRTRCRRVGKDGR